MSGGLQLTAAAVAGLAVGTSSQGNDTVVLSESRHGGDGHQSSQAAVETIGQNTTLDARLELRALDFKTGHIASGGNITDGLAGANDEDDHDGQDKRTVERQLEGLDPDEGAHGGGGDARIIEVTACGGDDASRQQTDDDTGGLHDGRTKALAQEDSDKDEETQADELGAAPGKSVRRRVVGAELEEAFGGTTGAKTTATSPVHEAGLDQMHTDENDGGTGDDGREDLLQSFGRDERDQDFRQGAESTGADERTVRVGARQTVAVRVQLTRSIGIHLRKCTSSDGDDGEGRSHDGDQARSEVVGGLVDVEAGNLDGRQNATDDQRSRNQVLLVVRREVDTALTGQNNGRSHDTGQHGQSVLESEQESQHNGHGIVQPEEGACATSLLDEWNVGSEEERIVVVAHETPLGEEGLANAVEAVGHRLLGAHIGADAICFTHF